MERNNLKKKYSVSNKLLLLGAGGHCSSVLDSLIRLNEFSEIGLITNEPLFEKMGYNIALVGCDNDLPQLFEKGYTHAFITVGSVGNYSVREKLLTIIKSIGFIVPNIIDPTASVSDTIELTQGIYVGKHCCINARSIIGDCAIINTGSIIEHDCTIEPFVHVATGAVLCGNVMVRKGTHIGAGAIIKQGIVIGEDSMIGMGSIVLNDIPDSVSAFGFPCKVKDVK